MQLLEILQSLPQEGDDIVLCAKEPFTWGTDAKLVKLTIEYGVPDEVAAAGFRYLLGLEELRDLLSSANDKQCSAKTKAELVCHYALFDAYPAWFDDLPPQAP